MKTNFHGDTKGLIVITGVTRGCGRALFDGFSRAGYQIAGCGTNKAAIEELSRSQDPKHIFSVVNVSSDTQVKAWAAHVCESQGAPLYLINNAAVINRNAPLWKVSAEEFDRVIDVNLKGVANTIRHFVPPMIEAKRGIIVNFSSGWGRSTDAEVAPYCTTKWGIEGMTQSFAQELPEGLAAIALNPGIINTDMLKSCFAGGASNYPTPEKWAQKAVPFILALNPANNGQSLSVD